MLKQADNIVRIEGILSEVDLEHKNFVKDGKNCDAIGGTIKIKVEQQISGKTVFLEIPVHMFSTKYTKKGLINPSYENIEKIMESYTSIAASSADKADCIRITSGSIRTNEYYGRSGKLVSFITVNAAFVTRIKPEELKPAATFDVTFVVNSKDYEINKEGQETGRYLVTGILPQYNGKVDLINLFAESEGVINAVQSYWTEGATVRAKGKLNFTSKTEVYVEESDFGEPEEITRTINVSELIVTAGSQEIADETIAYDIDDIKKALVERKAMLEQKKNESAKPPEKPTGGSVFDGNF